MLLREMSVFIAGGGFFQGLFSAALLLSRSNDRTPSNGFLAGFFVFCSMNIVHSMLMPRDIAHTAALGMWTLELSQFFLVPLFAAYVRSLFVAQFRVRPKSFLYHGRPALRNEIADTSKIESRRMTSTSHALLGLLLLYLVSSFLLLRHSDFQEFRIYVAVALTVFIVVSSFREPFHKKAPARGLEGVESTNVTPPAAYARSALSEATASKLESDLKRLMETERPYLEGDLNLPILAHRLCVSRNHLSYVINQRLKRSFYDFINEYRVREVQRLMADPARAEHTLLAIAFDAGFSSKPAFNAVFKRVTGETPSGYRARIFRKNSLSLPDETTQRRA